MNSAEILIVDDELQMQKLLEITLQSNGYKITAAVTAKEGMLIAASHPPALILLDLGLPDESGHAVLKNLRAWYNKPIIILSVQDREDDIVMALDNGANDYLIKPFRTGELLARIRSALRDKSDINTDQRIVTGDLQIDLAARTVKKNNVLIKLTSTEYNLLALFVKQEGRVLTYQYVLKEIWGPTYINQSQYLRVYIAQLRKKIETDANHPAYLITESGVGYRFAATE